MKVSLSADELRLVKAGLAMLGLKLLYDQKDARGEPYDLADYLADAHGAANWQLSGYKPSPAEVEVLLRDLVNGR